MAGLALAALVNCGKDHSPEVDRSDRVGGLRISWIRPSAGALLSDSIRCLVRIEGGVVDRAELRADDLPAVERTDEPWTFCWLPPDTATAGGGGERTIRLTIAARDTLGVVSGSEPLVIRWFPNGAPRLRFVGIEGPAWVERAEGESLSVEAIDPEDGILGVASIEWRSDRQGVVGHGRSLPVVSLIRGRHILDVSATDRWLRTTSVALELEAFDYSDRRTPAGVLEDVRHALLDRRPDRYAEALGGDFSFIFCPADREADPAIPVRWSAAGEEQFARRCLSWDDLRFLLADWTIASLQPAGFDEGAVAKAEVVSIALRLADGPRDTLVVSGGSARIYLRRADVTGSWKLIQWSDLGAQTAMTQGRLRFRIANRPENGGAGTS